MSVTRYYTFTGTLGGKNGFADGTEYVLNKGLLYNAGNATTLKPQRWYLSITDRNAGSAGS